MELNKQEWYSKLLAKLKRIESGELSLTSYIAEVEEKLRQPNVSHIGGDTIEDGLGGVWSKYCPMCSRNGMQVIRPGKVQCRYCG